MQPEKLIYEKEFFDKLFDRHNIIKPSIGNMYYRISCWKNNKRVIIAQRIHVITMKLKNPGLFETGRKHIHHKDGNILNNSFDNLEVMSPSEHAKKHGVFSSLKGKTYDEIYGDKADEMRKKVVRNCHTPEANRKRRNTMRNTMKNKRLICDNLKKVFLLSNGSNSKQQPHQ